MFRPRNGRQSAPCSGKAIETRSQILHAHWRRACEACHERLPDRRNNAKYLKLALDWLLGQSLAKERFREDCTWSPLHLAAAALLWAWSDESTFTERFFSARAVVSTATG